LRAPNFENACGTARDSQSKGKALERSRIENSRKNKAREEAGHF
jgi:hypothetical protein